jgi:hypothetical protein
MSEVKGFKVFNPDWTCRGFQYEVGKTYEEDVDLEVCENGFHFCKTPASCFSYYRFNNNNKVAEVIALGDIVETSDKCCTNKIKIVREIPWEEVLALVNTGKNNTGFGNSGDCNSGNYNSGNENSGDSNSGHWNSGYWNSGYRNSGNWNSGYCNIGNSNSGDYNSGRYNSSYCNSGYHNSGNYNSGNYNSGNKNSGSGNSGDCNSGNRNTGNYNAGNYCTGDFNTNDYETGYLCTKKSNVRLFNKESNMTYEEWRNSKAYSLLRRVYFVPVQWVSLPEMTEEEKEKYPNYAIAGGYLKEQDTSNCYIEWWNELDEEEKEIIKGIPNFDPNIFFEITGIRV